MLAAKNFSLIRLFKLKYYGNSTFITQIIHSNTHVNPLKGIFFEKQLTLQKLKTFMSVNTAFKDPMLRSGERKPKENCAFLPKPFLITKGRKFRTTD